MLKRHATHQRNPQTTHQPTTKPAPPTMETSLAVESNLLPVSPKAGTVGWDGPFSLGAVSSAGPVLKLILAERGCFSKIMFSSRIRVFLPSCAAWGPGQPRGYSGSCIWSSLGGRWGSFRLVLKLHSHGKHSAFIYVLRHKSIKHKNVL